MRILIVGDSITAGVTGCDYTRLIKAELPQIEIINLGRGGDTIHGIRRRAVRYLQRRPAIHAVILEAGHNDIILPFFWRRGWPYKAVVIGLWLRGSIAAQDGADFEAHYRGTLQDIRRLTQAPIIVTTLSCLNEDLSAATNHTRAVYNELIRRAATEHDCQLAEVGEVFDRRLSAGGRSYCMDDLASVLVSGPDCSRTPERATRLSRQRGLKLTIDGVHLNQQGAQIYKQVLVEALKTYGVV